MTNPRTATGSHHRVASQPVLAFQSVTKRFGSRVAVEDVDFELGEGRTLGIVGESGSGKTTCIRLALGLERPTAGKIIFRGSVYRSSRRAMRRLRRRFGFVFQDPYDSLDPRLTLEQIVGEPLRIHGVSWQERRMRVKTCLADVGLPDAPLKSYPSHYSGGGRQRIAIARALVMEPEVLLCDEPTASLDVSVQSQIVNLLLALKQARLLSMIFVSHDLGLVRRIADDIAVMHGGRVVESGPARAIYEHPRHPYTASLLAAVPGDHPSRRRIVGHPGNEEPKEMAPRNACLFVTRCSRAQEVCASERPPLEAGCENRRVACFFPIEVASHQVAPEAHVSYGISGEG